jgi:hypothetical protein
MRIFKRLLPGLFVLLALLAVPACAQAAFELRPGSFKVVQSSYQAGAHADVTTSFAFKKNEAGAVDGIWRSAEVIYPRGVAGYPPNVKTCDPPQLQLEACPADAQIGTLEFVLRAYPGFLSVNFVPVYNMVAPRGLVAVYGFVVKNLISGNIVLSVGSAPEYRVHAAITNVITGYEFTRQSITIWGVPADPSHEAQRGLSCQQLGPSEYLEPAPGPGETPEYCYSPGGVKADENPAPYLVNPTQCTAAPVQAELRGVEDWEGEKIAPVTTDVGPFTGCESLRFPPTLSVAPEETRPTIPTGYEIDLKVPQSEGAEGLGTADLRDAVVKLPAGVVLSPSAANGLVSCSEAQVGLDNEEPAGCPPASQLGTVSIVTPSLVHGLKGYLFLGGPPSGPIAGPPFTLYLTAEGNGVHLKIRGTATPDPGTGQITTVFDENPDLPFSELKVHLTGGSRATVANPSACGEYSAESDFTPWASPFIADATPRSAPFQITGCGAPRFDPSFQAGTTSNQAGGYSPLSVTFGREDGEQDLSGLTTTTPPGLLGNLSKVSLCPEPQAAQGTCPEASQIGEVTAGAGPGPEPVFIKGGRVYLTGPYDGAPFGLTVDVSEKAGPLDLAAGTPCDCEVVRATVSLDPHTSQITVINGAIPTKKDGIPFQVKKVNVLIDRPEFIFNPSSCDAMSTQGTLSSTQGTLAHEESHFQATNCQALKFEPKLTVSTQGRTSKADGASLLFKLTKPDVQGEQADLAKLKVELPKQLPSRLTTLQRACLAKVFASDPAGCPSESVVGHMRAITPILPVPLEGPMYFVSNGGEAFPNLIVVLQGYGVTIELVGDTFISKAGVTSSTFKTIPDAPFSEAEVYLPEGRYSALAANGNLCSLTHTVTTKKRVTETVHGKRQRVTRKSAKRVAQSLTMPTELVAQNGATIHRITPVQVTGCPPARPKAAKAKSAKAKSASRRGRK